LLPDSAQHVTSHNHGWRPEERGGINLIAWFLRAGEYFSDDRIAEPAIPKQS
jgi:hypothetical protein